MSYPEPNNIPLPPNISRDAVGNYFSIDPDELTVNHYYNYGWYSGYYNGWHDGCTNCTNRPIINRPIINRGYPHNNNNNNRPHRHGGKKKHNKTKKKRKSKKYST